MEEKRAISINDWITTPEGICQVVGIQDYVVEEFFSNDFPDLKVGDTFETKVVWKMFCDFEGKLRRSKFFNWSSIESCRPLKQKYENLLETVITENQVAYERFVNRVPSKPVMSAVEFSIRVEPSVKSNVLESINVLLADMPQAFSFSELETRLSNEVEGILTGLISAPSDVLNTNVLVSLDYEILKRNECRIEFVSGIAVGTYCEADGEWL
jgi:hypothetical protein